MFIFLILAANSYLGFTFSSQRHFQLQEHKGFFEKNQSQSLMISLVFEIWGIFRRFFFVSFVRNMKSLSLPISKSCLCSILRFFLFLLFRMRERGREKIAWKWHLVALRRIRQVHVRKLVLSPVETSLWKEYSVLSCQLQQWHGFATLDQATGLSSLSLWQQPAHGTSGWRYPTHTHRSVGWSMEPWPSYLSHPHCFLPVFLKNSLNTSTAFVVCFLRCFLLGIRSVKH